MFWWKLTKNKDYEDMLQFQLLRCVAYPFNYLNVFFCYYFQYILTIILKYLYLCTILNAVLWPVLEYFYTACIRSHLQ